MKLKIPAIAVFLAASIVQVSLGDSISVLGVKPSLVLVTVYALSVTGGEWRGMLYGAMGGFIEGCLSGGYPALFLSGYALVGYLAGRAGRRVFNIGESANFLGIFVLSLVQAVYMAAIMKTLYGDFGALHLALRFGIAQAAYNALAGAALLWLFKGQVAGRAPWLRVIRNLQVRV